MPDIVLMTDWVLTDRVLGCDASCDDACDIVSLSARAKELSGIGKGSHISADGKARFDVSTQSAIACRFPGGSSSDAVTHLRFVDMEVDVCSAE